MGENLETVWPGWETVRRIGHGGFGVVYEIQKKMLDRVERAAVKVISLPRDPGDIQALYQEGYDFKYISSFYAENLKQISNEYSLMREMNDCANIVRCDESKYKRHEDQIGGDFYIKMELLTPLTEALPEDIPEESTIRVGMDMCCALNACRRLNIVHRDIKPQNIFVTNSGCYKLGDFGIAKIVEQTAGGTRIGSYQYVAPEVYYGQPYGASADIYSLGLVLYWMLNNRRMPFFPQDLSQLKIGTEQTLLQRRLSDERLPPPAHGGEELKRIVLKACAHAPQERYSSAAEMLEDLRNYQKEYCANRAVPPGDDETVLMDENRGEDAAPGTGGDRTVDTVSDKISDEDRTKKAIPYRLTALILAGVLCATVVAAGVFYMRRGGDTEISVTDIPESAMPEGVTAGAEWSDWLETLPEFVSDERYEIETTTRYRSREKETTTSSEAAMEGWEQYDTSISTGEYGAWSNWSTVPVAESDTRKVEAATQYRYRDRQTTTSSNSQLEGWTLVNQTSAWGPYGTWSAWQTAQVSGSDSRQVERKTQYSSRTKTVRQEYTDWGTWSSWQDGSVSEDDKTDVESRTVYAYYYFSCPGCGKHYPAWDFACWECGTQVLEGSWHQTFDTAAWSSTSPDWEGTGRNSIVINGERWFQWTDGGTKTQYRYRTRGLEDAVSYSNWSEYQDSAISSSPTCEVRTRTLYRYRDRPLQTTYHFSRWGEWSAWGTAPVSETANRQVETQTVYRHAEKGQSTVYHFWKWGEWSEFGDAEIKQTGDIEVETKQFYRYREITPA